MRTIADLQTLGYFVGNAWGSVQVEEDALAAAQAAASPGIVIEQAGRIGTATLQDLANAGKLPTDPAQRAELATQIAAAALDMVSTHANEKVAFHQDAVAIAKTMPDVWRVEQHVGPAPAVGEPDGRQVILSALVACKADGTGWDEPSQAQLDALADKAAYAAREAQALMVPGA